MKVLPLWILQRTLSKQTLILDSCMADLQLRIQKAIREEFKESILITIAHRLRTVIGSFKYDVMLDLG